MNEPIGGLIHGNTHIYVVGSAPDSGVSIDEQKKHAEYMIRFINKIPENHKIKVFIVEREKELDYDKLKLEIDPEILDNWEKVPLGRPMRMMEFAQFLGISEVIFFIEIKGLIKSGLMIDPIFGRPIFMKVREIEVLSNKDEDPDEIYDDNEEDDL